MAKIRDLKKLKQDIDNGPIKVCTFDNFLVSFLAYTVNNLDFGNELDNEPELWKWLKGIFVPGDQIQKFPSGFPCTSASLNLKNVQ